ncbi:zinc finger protein 184-like isoform X2 [Pararge aegeria]|uniref:zinc finger protein 184-like isoform X2 n=1 Tax=Pararge aegeria TaxID=116150 RepID=UPI0019CF5173|nr:zinc finger protein 184-like isoform X2 [Pararge aegeria]
MLDLEMDIEEAAFYYCFGCLSRKDDKLTQTYIIQSEALKVVFQVDTLNLCYICKTIAQRSEQFIKNVQRNQSFLGNYKSIPDSIETSHNVPPLINLSRISLDNIQVTNENEDLEKPISVVYSSHAEDVEIKLELKQEVSMEPSDEELIDENDYQDSSIKGEKNVLEELKEENDSISDDINLKQLKRTVKKSKLKKKTKRPFQEKGEKKDKDPFIKVIRVSKEQCLKERMEMREDLKYKNSIYKCEDCVRGFNFKETYERHMEAHSKVMGEYECDICKRRMNSMEKLVSHKKYHEVRKVSLKKHLANVHRNRNTERLECKYCTKTFANKDGLNNHTMLKHPTELSERTFKHYICQDCGEAFKSPSQLKYHMTKHSDTKAFYCVECDRGFKSNYALKHHLKTAAPHANYLELRYQCENCEKRFGVPRELERHMNKVHLNRRPYQCDKCDRAYLTLWSLNQHKRFTHEGHKRPLKYPCPLCDKIFAGSATRKAHMRTHTGERPYVCSKCSATFSQSAALATHVKLVHLRLTRDGQPKKPAGSS